MYAVNIFPFKDEKLIFEIWGSNFARGIVFQALLVARLNFHIMLVKVSACDIMILIIRTRGKE